MTETQLARRIKVLKRRYSDMFKHSELKEGELCVAYSDPENVDNELEWWKSCGLRSAHKSAKKVQLEFGGDPKFAIIADASEFVAGSHYLTLIEAPQSCCKLKGGS